MKKIFTVFLFLILTAFLLFSYLLIQEKVNSETEVAQEDEVTVGWQTYENDKYKFGFKYPPDWNLEVSFDREDLFSLSIVKEDVDQEKVLLYEDEAVPSYNMMVRVEPNPKGISAREQRLSYFGEGSKEQEEKTFKDINVGGIKGIRFFEGAAPASGLATMVLLTYDGNFYQFSYGALAHQETHEKFLKDFETLLSTVEFFD